MNVSNAISGGGQRKVRSQIDLKELNCASCVPVIERGLEKIEGVESAKVNYLLSRLYVTFDPGRTNESMIEATLEKLGYRLRHKNYEGPVTRLLSRFGRHAGEKGK